jgi:hypothetical protein
MRGAAGVLSAALKLSTEKFGHYTVEVQSARTRSNKGYSQKKNPIAQKYLKMLKD